MLPQTFATLQQDDLDLKIPHLWLEIIYANQSGFCKHDHASPTYPPRES